MPSPYMQRRLLAVMSVCSVAPEVATDAVVSSLRNSWLYGAGPDAFYCVAAGMSKSKDPTLHWLYGLNRSREVASGRNDLNAKLFRKQGVSPPPPPSIPRSVAAAAAVEASKTLKQQSARARELTRIYNNFLRHKVFEILRQLCRAASNDSTPFEFAFMMDADTAVNRTNLERFAAAIDPSVPLYSGLCKRRSTWTNQAQRGVGGGPGILLSRSLLNDVCPRLEECAPLRSMMDRLHFAGGDLMLAKCMEFLGHRCSLEKEITYTRVASRLAAKGKGKLLGSPGSRLDEIFRRGPPWVYPPLAGGTILVASRRSAGARAIEMYQRLTMSRLPLSSVISFHRVKPSLRASGIDKDPRCRVFAEYRRLESGPAHWSSRCLPRFVLLGTPKSGTTSLFNWLLQHPDVRAPVRKELHFWAPVLSPDKNCADLPSCAVFRGGTDVSQYKNGTRLGSRKITIRWPLDKLAAGRMLSAYLELFPRSDPRSFEISGEASPAYLYSPSVALFLESTLCSHMRLIVLLRDPTERAFSEYKNKRDLMVKGAPKAAMWVNGHARFSKFVRELNERTASCSPEELYRACGPCVRFHRAPNANGTRVGTTSGAAAPAPPSSGADAKTEQSSRCAVSPVIWQSWYHLFIPRFMFHGRRLLIEFSDDMFDDAEATMKRVGSFVGLGPHNYSTNVAYNTERRRGAYISTSIQTRKNSNKKKLKTTATSHGANEARASDAASQRSSAPESQINIIKNLMRHSVFQLQEIMRLPSWDPPFEQLRRDIPPRWIEQYALHAIL